MNYTDKIWTPKDFSPWFLMSDNTVTYRTGRLLTWANEEKEVHSLPIEFTTN